MCSSDLTVSATRTGARIQDSPLHVEVLQQEEIEEEVMMKPGDMVMLLNEMGGMRVQTTSPSLGAASLRVATLLEKPGRRKYPHELHYVGFTIPDQFVVGFGLDFAQNYRNLPEIRTMHEI